MTRSEDLLFNVDWAGTAHARVAHIPRIACLVPSITELLFALGLGDHVVARTGFCIHPRAAIRRIPKIGGTKDPDLAQLRALAPTHLIVNVDENRRETAEAARAFVQHIIVTHPSTPQDNAKLYRLLGAIFDRAAAADLLVGQLADALATLDAAVAPLAREQVLYLVWRKPWMTVARDTYVAATLARAGLDTLPIAANERYPAIADDDPIWSETDRILLSTEPYAFRPRDADAIAARRGKRAQLVDGQWTSWYGVRAIAGLHSLARWRNEIAITDSSPQR